MAEVCRVVGARAGWVAGVCRVVRAGAGWVAELCRVGGAGPEGLAERGGVAPAIQWRRTDKFVIHSVPISVSTPTWTLLALLLSLLDTGAWAQRCVPSYRPADRQVLLPNGDLVVLATDFNGGLMDVFNQEKRIWVNCVRLDAAGRVKCNTTLALPWPERHYGYSEGNCGASYYDNTTGKIPGDSVFRDCRVYIPWLAPDDKLVVGYYLANDRRHAYELTIRQNGHASYRPIESDQPSLHLKIKQPDGISRRLTMGGELPFQDSFSKFLWVRFQVENHHPHLKNPAESVEAVPDAPGTYRLRAAPGVRLVSGSVAVGDGRRRHWEADTTLVRGPGWQVAVAGLLPSAQYAAATAERLYLTVLHAGPRGCPPDNDVWPVVYCLDLRTHRIVWQRHLSDRIYSSH